MYKTSQFNNLLGFALISVLTLVGHSTAQTVPSEARVTKQAKPNLSRGFEDSEVRGPVRLTVLVDEKGKPQQISGLSGPGFVCNDVSRDDVVAFRRAAYDAAMASSYAPASDGTKTIGGTVDLVIDFGEPRKIESKGDLEDKYFIAKSGGSDGSGTENTGGVLNGKALALPKPSYPAAARAVRASGTVQVQVLILEDGTILTAEATSGHPLLRSVSRTAACGAKFTQTLLEGTPVKVSGFITYNFVP